jgi:hypothetical protein
VYAPQVNRRALVAHEFRNWEKHIAKAQNQWLDLDLMIHRKGWLPNLYVEYGDYASDKIAVESLLRSLRVRRGYLLIERKIDKKDHTLNDCLRRDDVLNVLEMFHRVPLGKKN